VARLLAWTTVVAPLVVVVWPWIARTDTYGLYDWDVETSHRYLAQLSLLRYGEGPFWNPYACGGFPAWSFIEGGTFVVSPWLPFYLALPVRLALRAEVIGSGLLGALGAYAAAGRFTRSQAGRALVAALWAVNSRWALQAAVGHTWHLLYAWMPWCLYLYERCGGRDAKVRHTIGLAACFALMLFGGGIYPLPHVVVVLGIYAGVLAVQSRSWKPMVRLVVPGALGAAIAAPKLLPMLHEFGRSPRLIESNEVTSARVLWLALAGREQTLRARLAVLPYGWHEYGIYVSLAGLVVLTLAAVLVWGRRETILKCIAGFFVLLGLGAFHPLAPWTLLHAYVPFFASQHVPSRFLYPAVLLLAIVAGSGLGRIACRGRWLDAGAAALVLLLAVDVAGVAQQSMIESMRLTVPPIEPAATFHHEKKAPFHYKPIDFAIPMYPAMLGNRGVIECYGTTPIDHVGARSVTDPAYTGEANVTPSGEARVIDWSPNHVTLALESAATGSTVVYNMNYDDGWTSDAGDVTEVDGRVAVQLARPASTVTFWYRPRLLVPGLLLAGLGLFACALLAWVFGGRRPSWG
jgi:hypothetical protein